MRDANRLKSVLKGHLAYLGIRVLRVPCDLRIVNVTADISYADVVFQSTGFDVSLTVGGHDDMESLDV